MRNRTKKYGLNTVNKIAFFGPAASGKTWCADYIVESYGYRKLGFATKLKEIAVDLFNVRGKNGDDRKTLQKLGEKMREIDPNCWINYVLNNGAKNSGHFNGIVLDDLRYTNEAAALRSNGWALVKVVVPEEIRQWRLSTLYPDTPLSTYYHASEREWESILPDFSVPSSTDRVTEAELDKLIGYLKS